MAVTIPFAGDITFDSATFVAAVLWVFYQMYAPRYFDRNTWVHDHVKAAERQRESIEGKVDNLIQVQRGISREVDGVSSERVDKRHLGNAEKDDPKWFLEDDDSDDEYGSSPYAAPDDGDGDDGDLPPSGAFEVRGTDEDDEYDIGIFRRGEDEDQSDRYD